MSLQDIPLSASDVLAAHERLHGWVQHTPLLSSPWLSRLAGRPVLLKAENLQVTGSFKARGAVNCLLQLPPAERTRGVVTASAGNHGQAVAWAAAQLGIEATIVLPIDAVPVKSAAVTVAAVLGGLLPPGNGPIALILSGGNVDPGVLIQALAATSDAPAAN